MDKPGQSPSRAGTILLWIGSVAMALLIGLAGSAKFFAPKAWEPLFIGWGYPAWFSLVTGAAEVAGAIGLLIPRVAFFAAALLLAVMVGALVTLQTHRGSALGWGGTPSVYIVILSCIAWARWNDRVSRTATAS